MSTDSFFRTIRWNFGLVPDGLLNGPKLRYGSRLKARTGEPPYSFLYIIVFHLLSTKPEVFYCSIIMTNVTNSNNNIFTAAMVGVWHMVYDTGTVLRVQKYWVVLRHNYSANETGNSVPVKEIWNTLLCYVVVFWMLRRRTKLFLTKKLQLLVSKSSRCCRSIFSLPLQVL